MASDPYGPRSKRTPLKQPAVVEPRLRENEPTMVRCPLCAGGCMVTAEVAAMFDAMVRAYQETKA